MASPVNPASILAMLQARQGQTSSVPPGGAPSAAAGPDSAAADYSQQVAQLKGADPGGLLRQLKSMKQIMAIMAVQNLDRLPNVAGQLFKLIPQFDKVIKEAMQASNVSAAVRDPIKMSAAQPPPDGMQGNQPTGQQPSMGGMGGTNPLSFLT